MHTQIFIFSPVQMSLWSVVTPQVASWIGLRLFLVHIVISNDHITHKLIRILGLYCLYLD